MWGIMGASAVKVIRFIEASEYGTTVKFVSDGLYGK